MMSDPYYFDILKKLVDKQDPIEHDMLCLCRLSDTAFKCSIDKMISMGFAKSFCKDNKIYYVATEKGKEHLSLKHRNPNSIQNVQEKINSCWIAVDKLNPEDTIDLQFVDIGHIKFVTVLVRDNDGHVGIRNRLLHSKCGNAYLDATIKAEGWHWSEADWEPTHWMPMPK